MTTHLTLLFIAMQDAAKEPHHAKREFALLMTRYKGRQFAVHSRNAQLEVVDQEALLAVGTTQAHLVGVIVEDEMAFLDSCLDALL